MLTLILSLLILAGLFAVAWGIRACGQELKGLENYEERPTSNAKHRTSKEEK